MAESFPAASKPPEHPLYPDEPTDCEITIRLNGVTLPGNEQDQEELVENLVLYFAACLRGSDPGFNAGWEDTTFDYKIES